MSSALTRFERAHLIGTRLLQLENGALPCFTQDPSAYQHMALMEIAQRDVESGHLKWTLERRSQNGTVVFNRLLAEFRCAK